MLFRSANRDGIREELCLEAMRLTMLLGDSPHTDRPASRALLALMCFHSARLPARRDEQGHLVLLLDQDRSRWDWALVGRGFTALQASEPESGLTSYHLEALISAKHLLAPSPEETDWAGLAELYAKLWELQPSPVVRLSQAVVEGRLRGPRAGLALLDDVKKLAKYPYFHAARGELLADAGRVEEAREAYEEALALCTNEAEAAVLRRKVENLGVG